MGYILGRTAEKIGGGVNAKIKCQELSMVSPEFQNSEAIFYENHALIISYIAALFFPATNPRSPTIMLTPVPTR